MTITKNTIIAEILNNDPTQGCVPIFLSTGMHCLGCMASHGETVEEACAVHGVDADDHLCADGVDDLHIARRDAVVNDGGHQLRDDHFHDDLRDHKDRRQHGDQAEALGFTSECF